MREPHWYRAWKGDRKCLPKSDRQGLELAQTTLAKLQAQIAFYFGQPDGDLTDLQQGVKKLATKEPIICEACFREIYTAKHAPDCAIVVMHRDVLNNPPTPKH